MAYRTDPVPPEAEAFRHFNDKRGVGPQAGAMLQIVAEDHGLAWKTPLGVLTTAENYQRAWDLLVEKNPRVAGYLTEQTITRAMVDREARRLEETRALLRGHLGYIPPQLKP